MAEFDEEEELLRGAALQNARAINVARHRAERELAKERERLQITLASIGDGVISTDVEGRVTFLNGVAEALTGWTQAEAAGLPLVEVFHIINEHTRRPAENPALRALRDGVVVELANHTVLIARDGRERPIDDSAAPIRDENGAPVGAILVFRDVTDRRHAEVVHARLAAIVESTGETILSTSLDCVIQTWNPAAERLFGYSAAEAIGRQTALIIPTERLGEEREIFARIVRGERVEAFETVRVARDGRHLDIALTVSPLVDSEGQVVGAAKVGRDISERKRAERALRASEGRHRFLAELAVATQPLVDPDEVMRVAARLLAGYLGVDRCAYAEIEDEATFVIIGDYTRGVGSIVGRWPVAAFGAECERRMLANEPYVMDDVDADPRAGRDLAAYRATEIQAVICVPLQKEGKFTAAMAVHQKTPRRWTHDEVALVHTVVGRCWEALERARVARTLRDSEARYRAMIEATPECVTLIDHDGTLLQMNPAGLAMIESDAVVAYGRSVYLVVAPDDRAAFQRFNEQVCRGQGGSIEFEIVGARGTRRRMESTAVPLPAPGGGYYQLAVGRDITARKLDQERLARALAREQEQGRQLRQLADASLTIHAAGSLTDALRVIAEEARRILGAERAVSSLTTGDDGAQTVAAVVEAPGRALAVDEAREQAALAREVARSNRPLRRTGGQMGADPSSGGWLAAPFIAHDGRNLGLIQVAGGGGGDFSEIDESVLVQLAHIASVAIENTRLYAQLREQDRRKDEFLALLAHELRNPLAPIRNGLQLLRLTADPAVRQRSQEMMDRQLGHMVRLIDDLLDIARIGQNKMELRRAPVPLAEAVSSAVEAARPAIDAAGHVLEIVLPREPIVLEADLTRLAQVFSNLLTNSAKYTEPGGRIRLEAQRHAGGVAVTVTDNGIGIPAAALPTIFDMFSQVDRTIERSRGGLGIGLALVKRLVELHGGTVTAASAGRDQGSRFTVQLPAEISVGVGPGAPQVAEAPASPRRRILVVDDNHDAASTMAEMLELLGNEVRTAGDGFEAITVAEAFRPQVILMDTGMPRLNGHDATRRIRQQSWGEAMTILALTGWGQDADRARSKEAGCDGHLVKPVDLLELEKLLAGLDAAP